MKDFLKTIVAKKEEEILADKGKVPISALRGLPLFSEPRRSFSRALRINGCAIIAEVKKASPSKGVIRSSFDHKQIAGEYVEGGANALSVLTDREFFQGDKEYLEQIRNTVSVPLLRKDFIIDPYQIVESKAYGADAILLIVAALERQRLQDLHDEACESGLECLVEVHSESEIELLSGIKATIIGVNNRNLSTFETDMENSIRLRPLLPIDVLTVSESGIASAADVRRLVATGYNAVLIGETFMRTSEPGKALRQLKNDLVDL
jgi:indole-3-glycerol phosphate synthase